LKIALIFHSKASVAEVRAVELVAGGRLVLELKLSSGRTEALEEHKRIK
jgi:hypothetical protein